MTESLEHSLQNIGPRQQQILGILNLVCTGPELEELHDVFVAYGKQAILKLSLQCCRTSVSLPPDQRSSLGSTIDSIFSSCNSRDSWTSMDSYTSRSSTMHVAAEQSESGNLEHRGCQTVRSTRSFHERQYPSSSNQAPLFPPMERPRRPAQYFCITCQKCYGDQDGLNRHRREKCESKKGWICLHCLPQSKAVFERQDRLRDHHNRKHNTEGELDVEGSVQQHPPKQAWGCSCCIASFNSIEKWHNHEMSHDSLVPWDGQSFDVKVENWSFDTLIKSLLFGSETLFPVVSASRYDWGRCSWSPENALGRSVQYALERRTLPQDILRPPEYASRSLAQNLVAYAYRIGSNGTPFEEHVPAPCALYDHIPITKSIAGFSPPDVSLTLRAYTRQKMPSQRVAPESATPAISDVDQSQRLGRTSCLRSPKPFTIPMTEDEDQLYFESLNSIYGHRVLDQMQQIPLESDAVDLIPQNVQAVEEYQTIQRGRSRQSSQSSIVCEPKRARLSRSRTRSRRAMVARPGSNIDTASWMDVPPLPSPRVREATLSALHTRSPDRSRSTLQAGADMCYDIESISATQSSRQLPVRASQFAVDQADDRNKMNCFNSEGFESSFYDLSQSSGY